MKLKSIGILMLSVLLIVGLLQVDAVGKHPVVQSIAKSIRQVVHWVWGPYTPPPQRTTLTIPYEFLNVKDSESTRSIPSEESVASPSTSKVIFDQREPSETDDTVIVWDEEASDDVQGVLEDSADSRLRLFLQEMSDSGDPVTDLFPETDWYDELGEDYDWTDLLSTPEEENEIILDAPIRSDFVEPLVDELKTRIQEKLEEGNGREEEWRDGR
jgi:hypothetical protein